MRVEVFVLNVRGTLIVRMSYLPWSSGGAPADPLFLFSVR